MCCFYKGKCDIVIRFGKNVLGQIWIHICQFMSILGAYVDLCLFWGAFFDLVLFLGHISIFRSRQRGTWFSLHSSFCILKYGSKHLCLLPKSTYASARGLFDYDLNDRTRNNGAKLIVKHFNTSVAQHFYPIKITTTWNAIPSEVVSSEQ